LCVSFSLFDATFVVMVNKRQRYIGSAVVTYSSLTSNPAVIHHAIPLYAAPVTVSVPTMTAVCRERYRSALTAQLQEVARSVNYRICTKAMCSYVTGSPGGGASIGETTIGAKELYVAVDARSSSLSTAVTLDYDTSSVINRRFVENK